MREIIFFHGKIIFPNSFSLEVVHMKNLLKWLVSAKILLKVGAVQVQCQEAEICLLNWRSDLK